MSAGSASTLTYVPADDSRVPPSRGRLRPGSGALIAGVILWTVVVAWWWQRRSLWLLDLIVEPVALLLGGTALSLVVIGLIRGRRALLAAALIPVLLATLVVAGPYALRFPQLWFRVHQPMYRAALTHEPADSYYGSPLPLPLRVLAVDGASSASDGVRFFPQWIGIPDDAGGYLYSPAGRPIGFDMYGRQCQRPLDLGSGWWLC